MASVCCDPNNRKRVVFEGLDGKRRTLRLGRMEKRHAQMIARFVEDIISAAAAGNAVEPRTADWLRDCPDVMFAKLVAVGLANPRDAVTAVRLGDFLDGYFKRRSDAKTATRVFYGHTIRNLIAFFGADRPLDSINPGEADDFRRWLVIHEKLSPATVARRCSLARTFFRDAVRRRLIPANPFDGVGGGPKNNPERSRFIDRATIQAVIDACPSAEWRCLVALSRFAGLRVPSEALSLRWSDIDWERDRMVIHSPKTAHHAGKATRVCPIFPELRPYLDDLFSVPDNAVYVLPSLRPASADRGDWKATNLRTQFERIIRRAGLTPWPRLWHNLRASRQTELAAEFPMHVVCDWLGNTQLIAAKHYLQVTDADFAAALKPSEKAARNPARNLSEPTRSEAHETPEHAKTPCFQGVSLNLMGGTGFEPVTSTV